MPDPRPDDRFDKVRRAVMLSMVFTSMRPVVFDHISGSAGSYTHDDYDDALAALVSIQADLETARQRLEVAEERAST